MPWGTVVEVVISEEDMHTKHKERMAVLDMCQSKVFMPEVGYKFAANLYYIPWE